jgi:hypothetical protein
VISREMALIRLVCKEDMLSCDPCDTSSNRQPFEATVDMREAELEVDGYFTEMLSSFGPRGCYNPLMCPSGSLLIRTKVVYLTFVLVQSFTEA